MKTFTVICILVLSNFARAEEKEEQLLEAVQAVRLIWTEWMGNAELVYNPINPTSIENYHGTWHGEYTQNGEAPKSQLNLRELPWRLCVLA